MRLIDADALRESYRESIEECRKWADEMRKSGNEEMVIRAEQSLATFVECSLRAKNAPTADVVERKSGKWKYMLRDSENDEYRCSVCSYPSGYNYDYCPHCGCQMREGEDNEQND